MISFGVVSAADIKPEISNVIRHIMSLPLLPFDKIGVGLYLIEKQAKKLLQPTMCKKMMDYLENEWWYGVTAPIMSCYNLPETTNNNINMFHKTIRQRFRGVSNAWTFTEKLKEVECLTFRDFELLLGGHAIGRERKTKLLTSNDKLNRAWRMIENGRLPTAVFFERASEIVRTIENQFRLIIDEYEDVELIRGTDILGENYQAPDRHLYTNQSEDILATTLKKRKSEERINTVAPLKITVIETPEPIVESKVSLIFCP